MTEDEATTSDATIVPIDAVAAAGQAIADTFQLGDEIVPSADWPTGDEVARFGVTVRGVIDGALLLAVDADTAARITTDTDRIAAAFEAALAAVAGPDGLALELGEFGELENIPSQCVEIRSGGQVTAVFGLAVDVADSPEDAPADGSAPGAGPTDYRPAPLTADGEVAGPSTGPLSLLHDVEMDVTVELGRTTMPIRDLLSLRPGMVVEIDRAASAPIDVLVNGRLIACGEVVVIDEEFGIRITDIVSGSAVS